MDVRVSRRDPLSTRADVLIVTVPKIDSEARQLPRLYQVLDRGLGGAIAAHLAAGSFAGKKDQRVDLPGVEGGPTRVLLAGLGD